MNGIEILNCEAVYNSLLPLWAVVTCLMLGVLSVGACLICVEAQSAGGAAVFGLCALCLIIGALVGREFDNKNSINYIEYNVIISDEVSLTEFNEKYEIIEQNGKIYTVKEK